MQSDYYRRLTWRSSDLFAPSRLKIKRANLHLAELADAAEKLPGRRIYNCAVRNPEPRKLEIAYVTASGMPIEFAGTLGDAVHNIRSAFDYIAVVLASRPLGTGNPKNIYLPTGIDREEFIKTRDGYRNTKGKKIDGKMKGARPEALRLVEELEPYGGGKHSIRELHDLDVMDKHKLLIPAVSLLSVRRMDITVDGKDIALGRANFQSNEDGTNITAVIEFPSEVGNVKIKQEFDPAFEIVFGKGQPLDGKPIVPTLLQLTDVAESFIKSCEDAFRLV